MYLLNDFTMCDTNMNMGKKKKNKHLKKGMNCVECQIANVFISYDYSSTEVNANSRSIIGTFGHLKHE